ncbi:DNA polymerase I [bacterium]|nr:DNA polymerase I [bacterium]
MPADPNTLFLIDGSALMFRSHFAFLRNPLVNSRGEITSAIFGFLNTLISLIEKEQPTHLAIVFDTAEPTFRHKQYKEYKATRQKMPEELVDQLGRLDQVLVATGLRILALPGWEADDVIGTLARQGEEQGYTVFMVTGDKDYQQLVTDKVKLYNPKPDGTLIWSPAEVEENFGVPPSQVVDVLALMGDSSDNVPGVAGVGPKTAVKLIKEYGTVENVLKSAPEMKPSKLKESLIEYADSARLSRELVTIDCHAPIEVNLDDLDVKPIYNAEIERLLTELELFRLLDRLRGSAPAAGGSGMKSATQRDYKIVRSAKEFKTLVGKWRKEKPLLSFDVETTSADPMLAELVGASFSVNEGEAYYISMAHFDAAPAGSRQFIRFGQQAEGALAAFLELAAELLEDKTIPKAGQNIKYDALVYLSYGIDVASLFFDTMIAAYLLNPGTRTLGIDELTRDYLKLSKIPTSELIGSGKNQGSMLDVDLEKIADYACEDADYALRLVHVLEPLLDSQKKLLDELEMPLMTVLRDMEFTGIRLDTALLSEMSKELERDLARLEKECYAAAGESFNLNSPKQLGTILFEKLKLPVQKKTKTGPSTDVDTLTALAPMHDLPAKLVDYRMLSKLKGTYVDALPDLVHPFTGRVHTTFSQTIAATGRLSSNNPNLQNIPIRTEVGRRIREAFVAGEPGWKILSADYGQIELRIMAHLSNDDTLLQAFNSGGDIHRETAAKIYGVPIAEVTPDMRRAAKTVNFGIIYGQTDFGLSEQLGIPRAEAKEFREQYFKLYPGVRLFMADTIAACREKGYVETLMGRRRQIADINNSNRQVREFAERIAINTPVQGSAADMIKVAMIRIHKRLKQEKFAARMLLQVHDELVFEAPESELLNLEMIVRDEMSGAMKLRVPIEVDVGFGANWLQAHS